MKDLKEGLSSTRKPDITHVRTPFMVYCARACEYGDSKYERSNYLRSTDSLKNDYLRLRQYLRATLNHISQTLDSMELNQANDPNLEQDTAMQIAAYAADFDSKPDCLIGASHLPHLAHAAASLNMAITQAVYSNLLPADPGRPWEQEELSFGPSIEEVEEALAPGDLQQVPRIDEAVFYTSKQTEAAFEVPGRGQYYFDVEKKEGSYCYAVPASSVVETNDVQIAVATGTIAKRIYAGG